MDTDSRVLVVGTTSDYIDWIRKCSPGSALFLTRKSIRRDAVEAIPSPGEELLCELEDLASVKELLAGHLRRWKIRLSGVACFDCESLSAASELAQEYALVFPAPEAVSNCRSKYESKELWKKNGVSCPQYQLISSAEEAWAFIENTGGPCVLKPVSGSGSELVFHCRTREECLSAVDLFYQSQQTGTPVNACADSQIRPLLAESFISGKEYSCDCLIADGRAEIIRITAKIGALSRPFGTTLAYSLISSPTEIGATSLSDKLFKAAESLGINKAICMVDFIVGETGVFFLEMTPRIGGDCLPHLVRRVHGVDMLAQAMDFARGKKTVQSVAGSRRRGVGLRIFADKQGVLHGVDTTHVENDPRIQEITLTRSAGHKIVLPPADYDSWLLGYLIFTPAEGVEPAVQCADILQSIHLEIR